MQLLLPLSSYLSILKRKKKGGIKAKTLSRRLTAFLTYFWGTPGRCVGHSWAVKGHWIVALERSPIPVLQHAVLRGSQARPHLGEAVDMGRRGKQRLEEQLTRTEGPKGPKECSACGQAQGGAVWQLQVTTQSPGRGWEGRAGRALQVQVTLL